MRLARLGVLFALALPFCACGFTGLTVQRRTVAAPVLPCAAMRTATADQLVAAFNRNADQVTNLRLDLKLLAKTGGRKTPIEETKPEADNSHLFLQKPSSLRFYASLTAVGASLKVFDLASDGTLFRLNIPHYDEVIQGRNDYVPAQVKSAWETLRPQIIVNALTTNPVPLGAGSHIVPLFERANTGGIYSVLQLQSGPAGGDIPARRLFFSRCDLLPQRQIFYDESGGIATDVTYDRFITIQGVALPQIIVIDRPVEDYSLQFTVKPGGIRLNQDLPSDVWTLDTPSGSKLVNVGPPGAN